MSLHEETALDENAATKNAKHAEGMPKLEGGAGSEARGREAEAQPGWSHLVEAFGSTGRIRAHGRDRSGRTRVFRKRAFALQSRSGIVVEPRESFLGEAQPPPKGGQPSQARSGRHLSIASVSSQLLAQRDLQQRHPAAGVTQCGW